MNAIYARPTPKPAYSVAMFALLFVFSATVVAQQDRVEDKPAKPLVSLSGVNSRIEKESYSLVTSAKDWTELWNRHTGDPAGEPIPAVDFDACMIVAVFSGKMTNCRGVRCVTLSDNAKTVVLRFQNLTFQTVATPDGRSVSKDVTPYGFFVVRRATKPVMIEKDVQRYLGMPPVWKEVAHFPGR